MAYTGSINFKFKGKILPCFFSPNNVENNDDISFNYFLN